MQHSCAQMPQQVLLQRSWAHVCTFQVEAPSQGAAPHDCLCMLPLTAPPQSPDDMQAADSTPQFNQPPVAALLAGRRNRRSAKLVSLRLPAPRAAECAAGRQRYMQCDPAMPCAACVRAQRAWAASGAATAPGTAATATLSSGVGQHSTTAAENRPCVPRAATPAARSPLRTAWRQQVSAVAARRRDRLLSRPESGACLQPQAAVQHVCAAHRARPLKTASGKARGEPGPTLRVQAPAYEPRLANDLHA